MIRQPFRIDYLPFIDSVFDGSPIKNRPHRAHFLHNSDIGVLPSSAASRGEFS